ncbi:glycosyltransferase family 9 protein [Flaviflexus huanghaiensis]|uniref:glycosyltransferase family 9 protein n=1 Tax=Flaviflexus huanghaiensis TaxID=1111473 RepID=UPI0019D5AD33|nr:glycosyltransferase family 9 protein [Flaviflexus huanghaiensis]
MSAPIILTLRALKLGDLLVAVPALRGLRRSRPHHRFILASPIGLKPVVDLIEPTIEILPTDGLHASLAIGEDIDIAVNLHGKGPQSHALLDELDSTVKIGFAADGWDGPEWVDDVHERERWVHLLRSFGMEADAMDLRLPRPDRDVTRFGAEPGVAVVHVGAAHGSRLWPVDRFARVAEYLATAGRRVVLTGSQAERPRALTVRNLVEEAFRGRVDVVAGQTDLLDLAAIIADAGVVVSADTGVAHLASAYGTPSVVLFGPSTPERWGPPPGPHRVLTVAHLRRGDLFADDPDPALLAVDTCDVTRALHSLM